MQASPANPDALNEAQRAFLDGEYQRALLLLEDLPVTPDRDVLLAQVQLRRGDPRATIATVEQMDLDSAAAPVRARALAYRGAASATLGEAGAARAAIAAAKAIRVRNESARFEVHYNQAYIEWMLQDAAAALAIVQRYLDDAAAAPLIQARFLSLRGWLYAAEGRFVDQIVSVQRAIGAVESAPSPDVGLLAWYAHNLAALVRDVPSPEGRETVFRLEASLAWTDDLRVPYFQTVRSVAWLRTLEGEYIAAFRKFNSAIALANTPILKTLAHLDKAETARFCKEDIVAQSELDEALELIDAFDWDNVFWEEGDVLLKAAELLAPSDARRAARYITMFERLRAGIARNAGYVHDNRLAAHADYADACVRLASSDRRLARHRAMRAYRIYEAAGYQWYAARSALLLHSLGEKGDWLERAQKAIAPYPRSFIAEQIAHAAGQRNPLHDLTARQVEILQHLRTGRTIDDIGQTLGISSNTVRVHITHIHRAFGVERRSQLLIEAARWLDVA